MTSQAESVAYQIRRQSKESQQSKLIESATCCCSWLSVIVLLLPEQSGVPNNGKAKLMQKKKNSADNTFEKKLTTFGQTPFWTHCGYSMLICCESKLTACVLQTSCVCVALMALHKKIHPLPFDFWKLQLAGIEFQAYVSCLSLSFAFEY